MAASGIIHALAVASLLLIIGAARPSKAQQAGSSLQYPTFINYTISDTSSMWSYNPSPTRDDESRYVWNSSFTGSNWTTYEVGQAGIGESSHWANGSNFPSLYLNFPLTSFQLLGDVQGLNHSDKIAPLTMIVDSRTPVNCTPTAGVICESQNLLWNFHKIQINLNSGNWTIRGMQVVTGAPIKEESLENTATLVQHFRFDNGSLNPFYNFSGNWWISDTLGGVGGQEPVNYTSLVGQDGASVNITVPPRTAWVRLDGLVRPDSDAFTLDWDPLPPLADSQMLFSAYNSWQAPSLLYAAPLDPETNYTLGISTWAATDNNPINGTTLGLVSMTFYNEDSHPQLPGFQGGTSKSVNKGAIAGGVVGGVVGLALIAGALWWLWRRRKKTQRRKVTPQPKEVTSSTFEIDDDPYIELDDLGAARPVPYVPPTPTTNESGIYNGTATPVGNGTATGTLSKAAMVAAAAAVGSSSGHTPLLASEDSSLSPSRANSGQPPTLLLNTNLGSQHNLPASSGPTPTRSVPTTPIATMNTLPGTLVGTSTGEPVHPIAAELKHGDTLRRSQRRPVQVAQEEDGGAVDEFELVPPVYNPAWAQERRGTPAAGPSSGLTLDTSDLGADVEGVPLSASARAPPPTLSVITSTPYLAISNNSSRASTPTSATRSPLTATSMVHSHIPSPLSAGSPTHIPSPLATSSPLRMERHLSERDYEHAPSPSSPLSPLRRLPSDQGSNPTLHSARSSPHATRGRLPSDHYDAPLSPRFSNSHSEH